MKKHNTGPLSSSVTFLSLPVAKKKKKSWKGHMHTTFAMHIRNWNLDPLIMWRTGIHPSAQRNVRFKLNEGLYFKIITGYFIHSPRIFMHSINWLHMHANWLKTSVWLHPLRSLVFYVFKGLLSFVSIPDHTGSFLIVIQRDFHKPYRKHE